MQATWRRRNFVIIYNNDDGKITCSDHELTIQTYHPTSNNTGLIWTLLLEGNERETNLCLFELFQETTLKLLSTTKSLVSSWISLIWSTIYHANFQIAVEVIETREKILWFFQILTNSLI